MYQQNNKYMSRFIKIEGYDGYDICDEGYVVSKKYKEDRILLPRINSRGYKYINLCKNGKYKSIRIHRLVALHFIEKKYGCDYVNHKDGNKLNNHYLNLEWCNLKENSTHSKNENLSKVFGMDNPNCKLSDKEIEDIRKLFLTKKYSYVELAKIYNVSDTHINNVVNFKRRKTSTNKNLNCEEGVGSPQVS